MLRNAWFIAVKDVQFMLREKETIVWLFVMPIVFMFFIGTVTGGFGGGGGARKDKLAVVVPDNAGFLAERIVKRLEENDYEIVRQTPGDDVSAFTRRIAIPERFTELALAGTEVKLQFGRKESGIGQDFDTVRVGRAVYTVLADVVAAADAGEEPNPAAFARLDEMPRTLTLKVEAAGKRKKIPTGYEQTIPGTLVMFTLLILLSSGSMMLVIERQQGLLRRLASTPISRAAVVLGKWAGKMALAVVQIAFAMLVGTLLFDMDWGPDPGMVGVVLFAWASLCASLGLLFGNLARTEGQAAGIGVAGALVLAALGGCWWPVEITPPWMQSLAASLPTGWTMGAMHQLVSFHAGAASCVPHVVALLVGALVAGWAGVRTFRYQ